ncbi:uncharacterized protein G2W53_030191 [Senna tora]|uniref:Uncharacterized protein n=1 Tax=Senna tora TaxID=362788 RepID=A0A834T6K0_9FABA|nr:uncharacterized protein G2W53_030191 [Senna tora]
MESGVGGGHNAADVAELEERG